MIDLHRLRIFRSVVASGSVQAAAANLGYTPSAVSQHLAALQRETGLALVARSGRGLRPTAAGLALASEADSVLGRIGETETLIADLRAGRTGSLSIAYFASVGAAWMPRIVRAVTEEFPGIRLDLALDDDGPGQLSDVHLVVAADRYDAGAGFTVRHLIDDPYVVVVPEDHPLAVRSEVELAELAAESWVDNDFSRGWCRRILLDTCAAAGFSPPFRVEAHDYPSALAFVAAGIGVTVLPALGAERLPPGTVAVPITRPTPVRSIHAILRDAVAQTPAGRLVQRLLAEIVEEQGAQRAGRDRGALDERRTNTRFPITP